MSLELPPVCLIISSQEIPHKAEIALRSGIKWIQFREKYLSRKALLEKAYQIKELTTKYNAILTINDYVDIALITQAEGVHLGQDDLPFEAAKKIFSGIIGISTHNLKEAQEAEKMGADYIGFGPIFHTTTKKDAVEPRGIDMLSFICKKINIPVVAIGGIKVENLEQLKNSGCKSIAVASGILEGDIEKNIMFFLKFFNQFYEKKSC